MSKRITQKYLRRWPDSRRAKSWAGRLVHISTENGVWREGGHGYTHAGADDAWALPFEEAQELVAHCGPEKCASFIDASGIHAKRFSKWLEDGPRLAHAAGLYVSIQVRGATP